MHDRISTHHAMSFSRTYTCPDIDILSDTLDSGSLVEITSGDTFPTKDSQIDFSNFEWICAPDDIPICSDRYVGIDPLLFHDILQLTTDFSSFPEQFGMQKVLH